MHRQSVRLLYLLFFISGLSALLYQIVWLKYLGFVFGNTVYAASTLIAIYLAGLGIGGFVFARWFNGRSALILYALVEALIGLIGAFSPNGFALLDQAYVAAFQAFIGSPLSLAVARAFFASIFLLPPTILMGGTLPLLVRWMTAEEGESGAAVSSLYAVNTFGATAGVAAAGFYLIPRFGLLETILVAVVLNFALAIAAALLGRSRSLNTPLTPTRESAEPGARPRLAAGLLFAALLMGFSSIADEVFWTRILVLHLGSSVYAYSLMLFSFLIGLAAGSALIYLRIERSNLERTLAILEISLAVVLALQVHYFVRFVDVLESLARLVGTATYTQTLLTLLAGTLSALLIPTALMGATFPLIVKLYGQATGATEGRSVGVVYFFNTVGSILGSLAAGFFLIRAAGSQNGLFLMAAINLILGFYFLLRGGWSRTTAAAAVAGSIVIAVAFLTAKPNQVILSAGLFVDQKADILLFREDVTATVTLRRFGPESLSLELNGVNVAGTSPDLIGTQKLQGHLPLLIHPDPKKVLHIGFGSGGTAHAVSLHPVERMTIAEISPEVLDVSSRGLRQVNHGVIDDPRVRVEINDGRNFVLATPEKFDVILSDSIHPRYAGNGSLYTKDYFELCRRKLQPGGVVSMWLPMYSLTSRNFLMILRAFQDVFPNTTVWYVPNAPNAFTIVIGRLEGGPIPLDRVRRKISPVVARELSEIGIRSEMDLATALMLGPDGVRAVARGVEPHIDNRPAVEYESGRIVDRGGSWLQNFDLLARASTRLAPAFSGLDPDAAGAAEKIRHERTREHLTWLIRQIEGTP